MSGTVPKMKLRYFVTNHLQFNEVSDNLGVTVRYLYSDGKPDLAIANKIDICLVSVLRGQDLI
jgi:hypothetical protein